ncbi:hypothetical protein LWI29_028362 [Acer saccharum]|uniref:Uncharacterized protein n=1 Tax=Acer saccharum TaxID=4024 RepID=A0AA39VT24_ACESA|nr:hypothetical protein LWI29_028362 [Acer saccharum]KAK1575819.1 hypothetical protein Q3G72_008637 [Acer saccharum]
MEQKNILLSALGVGVGLGVGLGLASGKTMNKWTGNNSASSNGVTAEKMEQELLRQVVEGRESKITFDEFPYYLRLQFPVIDSRNYDFLACGAELELSPIDKASSNVLLGNRRLPSQSSFSVTVPIKS